ncbi:MAG TPA: N-acetylmuramoyl-L-alanine amidase [Chloroflexota bacterium]|nr:N-acetylmuramoyl-L-alanine amidase [Chloroflexota bacterium]
MRPAILARVPPSVSFNNSRRRLIQTAAAVVAGLALAPRSLIAEALQPVFDADIGLDPGHSRVDVGASGAGVGEYQHTLDVALRIRPLLEDAGLRVNLSRNDDQPLTAMSHPNLTERTRIEQAARIEAVGKVRVYVSIHFNAGADARLSGTESYFNTDNAAPESLRLAQAVQRNVVGSLRELGHPVVDRGVKEDLLAGKPYGHFFSLRGGMPSALVEGLFLSNPVEAALLLREETRQAVARGYVGGILEYFAVVTSASATP